MAPKAPSNISVHGSEYPWFDCDGEGREEGEGDLHGELVASRSVALWFSIQEYLPAFTGVLRAQYVLLTPDFIFFLANKGEFMLFFMEVDVSGSFVMSFAGT